MQRLRSVTWFSNRVSSRGRLILSQSHDIPSYYSRRYSDSLFLDEFIVFECRRTSDSQWGWFVGDSWRDARGQSKVLQRGCARSSLSNYPNHRRSTTETFGDNTPGSSDFPWCRLTHYPSTSSISPWGCSTSWRRRADLLRDETQQPKQAREPTAPKNDTRPVGRSSVVTMSFSRKAAYIRQWWQDTR